GPAVMLCYAFRRARPLIAVHAREVLAGSGRDVGTELPSRPALSGTLREARILRGRMERIVVKAKAGARASDHTTTGDRAEHRRRQSSTACRGRVLPHPFAGRVLSTGDPVRRNVVRVQSRTAGAADHPRSRSAVHVHHRLALEAGPGTAAECRGA